MIYVAPLQGEGEGLGAKSLFQTFKKKEFGGSFPRSVGFGPRGPPPGVFLGGHRGVCIRVT